jgi:site-specific DNA-methyltransferase (cytosine-N4-specific)
LPEYFIRMLTDKGDVVFDPLAGSCVTGEVAQRLSRKWLCCEIVQEYLEGAVSRFSPRPAVLKKATAAYTVCNPAALWNGTDGEEPLPSGGGKRRPPSTV